MNPDSQLIASETLRLLCVSPAEPSWVAITMQLGGRGIEEPQFRWSSTPQEALTILRCEIFDAVLIVMSGTADEPAFETSRVTRLLEAMRTSGHDEPAVLVAPTLSGEDWAVCTRLECDVIASQDAWDAPPLVPAVLRAIHRSELARSFRRLEATNRKSAGREFQESERCLNHLSEVLTDRKLLDKSVTSTEATSVPEGMRTLYRQLLRTFCMMGEGGLSAELAQIADVLTSTHATPEEILEMHVRETRELVSRLGNRGAGRMLLRADLMIIELLMLVGQNYLDRKSVA